MEDKHISEVIAAEFERRSLTAFQQEWGIEISDGKYRLEGYGSCCGLGVLLLDKAAPPEEMYSQDDPELDVCVPVTLGLDPLYVRGFINGFDGRVKQVAIDDFDAEQETEIELSKFTKGFDDGALTWELLEKKGLVHFPYEDRK